MAIVESRVLGEEDLYPREPVEEPKEEFGDVLKDIMSASGKRLTWQIKKQLEATVQMFDALLESRRSKDSESTG